MSRAGKVKSTLNTFKARLLMRNASCVLPGLTLIPLIADGPFTFPLRSLAQDECKKGTVVDYQVRNIVWIIVTN